MHSSDQIRRGSFEHQVVMIAHEHVRVNAPPAAFAGLPECLQKGAAVASVFENGIAPIPAIQEVVDCSRKFHANSSSHGVLFSDGGRLLARQKF